MNMAITNDRLAQLIQFSTALVDANQCGVYQNQLLATPEEALEILAELAQLRGLIPLFDERKKLKLVKPEEIQ